MGILVVVAGAVVMFGLIGVARAITRRSGL